MMSELEKISRKKGFKEIIALTHDWNKRTQKINKKMGYKASSKLILFSKKIK